MSFSLFFRDFLISTTFAIFAKMKMFFLLVSTIVLGVTYSEGRVRRQIWPAPGNPNFFWNRPGNDFYDDGDFWPGPQRFDRPFGNQNEFRDDFSNGNDLDQDDFGDYFSNDSNQNPNKRSQNQNQNPNQNQNQNQNRRRTTTTTERSDPFATTPRTIHVAPQGCTCPMTQQFNPVCGTDGNTYRNKGLLNCYQRCGTNVSQRRLGVC